MTNLVYILALTFKFEAGGEGEVGLRAVASTIWNRADGDESKLKAVVWRDRQYSCWNNDGRAMKWYSRNMVPSPLDGPWIQCVVIAHELANGTFKPSGPWTHYHATSVNPYWSQGMTDVAIIGGHKFGRAK